MQSRAQLKRSIPTAHEKFQSALDNLSEQIVTSSSFKILRPVLTIVSLLPKLSLNETTRQCKQRKLPFSPPRMLL